MRFFIAILALFLTNSLLHSNSFNQLQQRIVEIFEQKQKSVVRVKAVFNQSNKEKDDKFTLMIGSGFFIGSPNLSWPEENAYVRLRDRLRERNRQRLLKNRKKY